MMCRGVRNWPLIPAVVELAEQVLVEVALGVALGQRQGVDHVDRRDQQAGLLDHQLGVVHVLSKGRFAVRPGVRK